MGGGGVSRGGRWFRGAAGGGKLVGRCEGKGRRGEEMQEEEEDVSEWGGREKTYRTRGGKRHPSA